MECFEKLFRENHIAIERFVRYRISQKADADDILGEVYLTAYQRFSQLKNESSFRPWIISIARNKCNDHFKSVAKKLEIPIEEVPESALIHTQQGISLLNVVTDTLESLNTNDREILQLYYFESLTQAEIARKLSLPLGTVKSRLHTAKVNFRTHYPYPPSYLKGETEMKDFPEILPEYTITEMNETPFIVTYKELPAYFIIPELGESVSWVNYDMPKRNITEKTEMKVTSKVLIHDIDGVEIHGKSTLFENGIQKGESDETTYYAQLTDTHSRWLGTEYIDENGVKRITTFLDGDKFNNEWGIGTDNSGNEIILKPTGRIKRKNSILTSENNQDYDLTGRYLIEIGSKKYDTVCVVHLYSDYTVSESYIDKSGRTVLWRRFNRNDWAYGTYGKKWTEMLPESERLTVNGEIYVHWYDSISDYILD